MAGRIVGNEPCPQCRERGRDKTGDHLMIFADGGGYCNRCEYYRSPDGEEQEEDMQVDPNELEVGALPSRGISEMFVAAYGGKVEYDTATREPVAVWLPRHKKGTLSGWKVIGLREKSFRAVGDGKDCDLFGMDLEGGNRLCIITEGELDCLAAKQMLAENGKDYRVVSLPNGATSRLNTASNEWLASFETIIIATDMDEAGNDAASRITEMFDPGKCKRAALPSKDANECLLNDQSRAFFSALMSARTITADGIVLASDTWEAVLEDHLNPASAGTPFPWQFLNDMAYGSREGELDTWCSGTGMGKTAIIRELIHNWSVVHGEKVGVLSLEEGLTHTILGQMSICANLPLHLPEVRASVSPEDLRTYWEQATAGDNLVCLDHWGSVEGSRLVQKIRYLASGMGCKKIAIDHLSILISEVATDGDERKNIDVLMTKLKRLTEELKIHISIISHVNSPTGGPSFEEGGIPSLNNLRGSRSIGQLSHGVFALSRNQQDPDPIRRNTSLITTLKCRFTGRTGPAGLLQYNTETGRMDESPLTIEEYRDGLTVSPLESRP